MLPLLESILETNCLHDFLSHNSRKSNA
jgi:hypothetical protein